MSRLVPYFVALFAACLSEHTPPFNSGKRAADEGRDAKYPNIDFCRDPEAICSSKEHGELKWIAGFFYWVESVQTYDGEGWNYMQELHKYVDEGMQGQHNSISLLVQSAITLTFSDSCSLGDAFINAVSGKTYI